MPTTYKSWANGFKTLVNNSYKKGTDYRQGVFFMDTTENWEDRLVEIEGIDDFSIWLDGERASQSEIKEGFAKRLVQVPYGKEIPFGRLFRKFQPNDLRATKRAMKELAAKAYRLEQKAAYSWLGYAFADTNTYLSGVTGSTVSALGPDGKRLASVIHQVSPNSSETYSNALSDNAPVGEDALKAHIENLNNQKDAKGEKLHFGEGGYIWLVSLEDFPEASRVVGSELRSGTSDNDKNVYKGSFMSRPIEVRMVPWMSDFGSTTLHALVAKESTEMEQNLMVLSSIPFLADDYMDDTTKTAYIRAELGFSTGFLSGRGLSLSQGTGTGTYTD